MPASIISVQSLSKRYHLGATLGHDTLRDHITHAARSVAGLFGGKTKSAGNGEADHIWALKNISFDVQPGEVLGIIGRNGAGKSTLLKILSRITEPTEGEVRIKGRIASLLEVGTGFHQELTGRENIYLNGAILGMRKAEINRKFDEIVAFSEVEKFLDTPVKHYSSGMHMRLAFGVAAHLEPEILVVDEVLAVGDAQFQKKCLGKIQDVTQQEGRTVLFVSHNMTAIKSLCTQVVLLEKGRVAHMGDVNDVVNTYLQKATANVLEQTFDSWENAPGTKQVRVKSLKAIPELPDGALQATVKTPIRIECELWTQFTQARLNLSMFLNDIGGECIFNASSSAHDVSNGVCKFMCHIPGDLLNDGIYTISVKIVRDRSVALFDFKEAVTFEVFDERKGMAWHGKWPGAVRPRLHWQFMQISPNEP